MVLASTTSNSVHDLFLRSIDLDSNDSLSLPYFPISWYNFVFANLYGVISSQYSLFQSMYCY
jgi:hypothetical protein